MASKKSPGSQLKQIDAVHKRLDKSLKKVGDKALEKELRQILHELAELHLKLYGGGDIGRWYP